MFSLILKVIPRLEPKDLGAMERSLSSRFSRVAKGFGRGLVNVLKGGGVIGAISLLIDKVLNPLKEVQEAIDRSLQRGDDLTTYAKQFGTTAGNLSRLQAFGKATGLEPEGVRLLLGKFQAAVAQSAADPSKPTAVSAFVGRKDTAEAFFEFVQSLQKLDPTRQNLVQQEVFGERQILKASEFLNADFKNLESIFRQAAPGSMQQTAAAEWLGAMSDNRDILDAIREQNDLIQKSKLIRDNTVAGIARSADLQQKIENQKVGKFDSIQQLSDANTKLMNEALNAFMQLAPGLAKLASVAASVLKDGQIDLKELKASRSMRGILPGAGKDK